eukprot:Nk52_evm16s158 gene=Nk52_evmTU16s158
MTMKMRSLVMLSGRCCYYQHHGMSSMSAVRGGAPITNMLLGRVINVSGARDTQHKHNLHTLTSQSQVLTVSYNIFNASARGSSRAFSSSCVSARRMDNFTTLPMRSKSVPADRGFTVDTFLGKIGRGLAGKAAAFESWEDLFSCNSRKLEQKGIETKERKHLLNMMERFRRGIDPHMMGPTKSERPTIKNKTRILARRKNKKMAILKRRAAVEEAADFKRLLGME